jgi:hypothetical protein
MIRAEGGFGLPQRLAPELLRLREISAPEMLLGLVLEQLPLRLAGQDRRSGQQQERCRCRKNVIRDS